jgi:hypothetical protein
MGRVRRKMEQIALRIPANTAERADALIEYVEGFPGVQALGRKVTRSTVIRMAIDRGLDVLADEWEKIQAETEQAG